MPTGIGNLSFEIFCNIIMAGEQDILHKKGRKEIEIFVARCVPQQYRKVKCYFTFY